MRSTSAPLLFNLSQPANLPNLSEESLSDWRLVLAFVSHLAAYFALLVIIGIVTLIILKFAFDLRGNDNFEEESVRPTEANSLMSSKTTPFSYGTWAEDLEAGNCQEELDEGKNICIICYNEQRNCFFVPCGHYATCFDCAQRIYDRENKACPVCRRMIGRIRKVFAL